MFSRTLQTTFAISPPVFQEFVRCSNKDIEQIIKKEMSGDVKNAMFAIGKNCLDNDQASKYFYFMTNYFEFTFLNNTVVISSLNQK